MPTHKPKQEFKAALNVRCSQCYGQHASRSMFLVNGAYICQGCISKDGAHKNIFEKKL